MSETGTAFLVLGVLLSAALVWGLVTGKMLSRYFVDDRGEDPVHYWIGAAVNALLALVCFYMAWSEW